MRRARPVVACHERLEQLEARVLSDAELLTLVLSRTAGTNSPAAPPGAPRPRLGVLPGIG